MDLEAAAFGSRDETKRKLLNAVGGFETYFEPDQGFILNHGERLVANGEKQFQEAFPLQGPSAAYLKFYFAPPRSHYGTKKGQIADAKPDAQILQRLEGRFRQSREGRNGCCDAVTCVARRQPLRT